MAAVRNAAVSRTSSSTGPQRVGLAADVRIPSPNEHVARRFVRLGRPGRRGILGGDRPGLAGVPDAGERQKDVRRVAVEVVQQVRDALGPRSHQISGWHRVEQRELGLGSEQRSAALEDHPQHDGEVGGVERTGGSTLTRSRSEPLSRWRRESNPRTGLCRPLPKPLGHATRGVVTIDADTAPPNHRDEGAAHRRLPKERSGLRTRWRPGRDAPRPSGRSRGPWTVRLPLTGSPHPRTASGGLTRPLMTNSDRT